MRNLTQRILNPFQRVWKDQRGITGLETAIVLIAFVVVASVFAYAVITTGLFSSEKAKSSAEAGVKEAKSSLAPKGSLVILQAQSYGEVTTLHATNLIDAAGDFVNAGVIVGDLVRNVTDGSTGTVTVVAATTLDIAALTGGTENDWDVGEVYEVSLSNVAEVEKITFTVVPSAGALPMNLASANTVVKYTDKNNSMSATYDAVFPRDESPPVAMTSNTAYWKHTWLVGSGNGIEAGEVVEFTLEVRKLGIALGANTEFKVEIVPQTGAVMAMTRTTPLELTKVMDLN